MLTVSLACILISSSVLINFPTGLEHAEAASADDPVRLTIGAVARIDSLNPLAGYFSMSGQIYFQMYEMLVGLDEDLKPTPQIAESWETSPDGLVWTFHIRHGMKWHDNVTVTAADVNWTYNLVMSDPVAGGLYADYLSNVTDCRALDDYSLQMTMDVPKATMLTIDIPILPNHLWTNVPSGDLAAVDVFDTNYFPDGPIGSGPWRLVDYAIDDFCKLQKFPYYYGGTANIDEVVYKFFSSPQSMLNAFYAGSIDIAADVPADSWETTLNKPNTDGQTVIQNVFEQLGLNVCPPSMRVDGASSNYELLNLSVRQAIAMSIDKESIIQDVYLGLAESGDVLVTPAITQWHYNLTQGETYVFDLDAANALLDSSGYSADADGDGIRENETSGKELEFSFYYIVASVEQGTIAYMVESWLSQIGIKATPNGLSGSALLDLWIGMKYDMFIWGWGGGVDPSFILSIMTTEQIPEDLNDWGSWSDCFYSNPYYDSLFLQQKRTINVTERQQIVYEMQRIVYRDSPYVILDYSLGLYAYKTDRFTNWPDMASHPGMAPLGLTSGKYLFFELFPISGNLPPQNAAAGEDTIVAFGESRSLTGYAEDENPATLNWTWRFTKPEAGLDILYGRSVDYMFSEEGTYAVTLTVTDEGGLEAQDQITVVSQIISNAGLLVGYVNESGDVPIVAAIVTAGLGSATTDNAGYYHMMLAPGTYDVSADAAGFQAASQSAVVVANLTTTLSFTLISGSGSLSGKIYDAKTGDPVEGAIVSVQMGNASKLVTSNATGEFLMPILEAGEYSVNTSKAGYETNSSTTTIVIGQRTILNIELNPVDDESALSTAVIALIAGIVVVVVVASLAFMMMKRKKSAGQEPPLPPT